ncbi:MAG: hypothetical protein Q7R41_17395 [Phycisphaerales bacterium]|nr:hypothetical protein [Phycisphaerales bacterium]
MPDEPTPKQPSDSSASRDWESASEKDVEQKLALAAELAGELAGHVGAAPMGTSSKDAVGDAGPLTNIEKELDAELNELEHLVGKTQAEVGEDKSEDHHPPDDREFPNRASPDNAAPDRRPAAVPEFMSEFTSPEAPTKDLDDADDDGGDTLEDESATEPLPPEAAPVTAGVLAGTKPPAPEMTAVGATAAPPGAKVGGAAGPPSVRSTRPGAIGTGTLPVTSDYRKDPPAAAGGPSLDPGTIKGLADASVKPVGSSEGSGQRSTLLLTLCECGVRILERIDQPFARLSGRVRYGVGFIAVATAVVSIVVFIYSLM